MQLRSSVLLTALAAFSTVALAAHQYNTSNSTTLSGTVTKVEWNNKNYVKIHVNAAGKQGKKADWEIQTVPGQTLQADGITQSTLKNGDQITVQGYQAVNDSPHMLAKSITLANGQTVAINAQEQAEETGEQASSNTQSVPGTRSLNAQSSNAQSSNSESSDQQSLPRTASDAPLIGIIGLVSLIGGGVLALSRRDS